MILRRGVFRPKQVFVAVCASVLRLAVEGEMSNKMKRKASSLRIDKNKLKVVTFCVLLCVSNFLPALEAKKTSKSRGKSSSSGVSTGRVAKPSQTVPQSYSNPGSLSYGSSYQQKPKPNPSAPVDTSANSRPIGWNVNQNQAGKPAAAAPPYPVQNAAKPPPYPVQGAAKPPYPVQQTHNTHQTHGAPPPPYNVNQQHGGPPPYSAVNNPNVHSPFNQPPPVYSPGNQGFKPGQPGGFGQPGFGQPGSYGGHQQSGFGGHAPGGFGGHAPGAYGQPGGYHPPSPYGGFPSGGQNYHAPASGFTGGLPHGGLSGGGVAPPVNYAPAPSFPITAIPAGAYRPQSSGIGIGGIAAGVGTGLLAGAAGAAIYNALKPEDRVIYRDRVTVVNANPAEAPAAGVAPAAAAGVAVAAAGPASGPPAAAAPAPVAPAAADGTNPQPPATPEGGASGVPNTPIIMNNNATDAEQPASVNGTETSTNASETPLAAYDGTTPAPPTTGKQYYPPPGQYYPATGQYVPPGEYDFATGVFTPGRYIPDTNIFQQGQYDPLTQIFTPGSYDPSNGQFVPDPNNGPINLGAPLAQEAAAVTSQPLSQAPEDVTVGAGSTFGVSSLLVAVVPAMLAAIARYQ